ncbi:MAG: hypothetical protein M9962_10075 [Oligoflexia bacterium]|nr:hypothetical protein [Oligoflexia bacterium]
MNIKFLGLIIAAIALPITGFAESKTACLIHVKTNHPFCVSAARISPQAANYYKVNTSFADSEGLANMNAARCLERALEYANWCGDGAGIKTTGAFAYFVVDGRSVINAYADTATQKTSIGDGLARFTRFKD